MSERPGAGETVGECEQNSVKNFGLEEEKQIGGLLVRRKDFLSSSFNDRRNLSLLKYW